MYLCLSLRVVISIDKCVFWPIHSPWLWPTEVLEARIEMKEESDRQFWEISTQEQIEIVDEESQKQCYEAAFAGIQEAMSKSVHDGKMQFQDEFILLLY